MYVFVEIAVDMDHLVAAIKHNFDASKRLLLVGTVQFVSCIHKVRPTLEQHFASVAVPQSRPLSKGEVLGCTAPTIDAGSADVVIYVGDGRFHLEAIMIANPSLPYYRYDPYSKVISAEGYAHDQLHYNRKKAIAACSDAKVHRILKKSLFTVALYRRYTSWLTFENVGQGVRRHPGPFLLLLALCTMRSQGGRALSACGAARAQSESERASERERGREACR
jgi:diphthamide biosynthesis enzyme Dph1/Dph2-like protein